MAPDGPPTSQLVLTVRAVIFVNVRRVVAAFAVNVPWNGADQQGSFARQDFDKTITDFWEELW
jgi:hypothetical protein